MPQRFSSTRLMGGSSAPSSCHPYTAVLAVYRVGTRNAIGRKHIPVFRSSSALTRVKIRSYAFFLVPPEINNLTLVDFVGTSVRQASPSLLDGHYLGKEILT